MFIGETGIGNMLAHATKGVPYEVGGCRVVTVALDVIQGQMMVWFIIKI